MPKQADRTSNELEGRAASLEELEAAAGQMEPEPEPVPKSRLKWILIIAAIVIVIVAVPLWSYYSVRESTDDAQVDGHIHPISARVAGTITRVFVENNQYVEAGTVLAQIDQRDYQTALGKAQGDLAEQEGLWKASQSDLPVTSQTTASHLSDAEAALAEARASLGAAQKEAEASRAQLNAAQAKQREAAANSEKAGRDLERMKTLIAKEEISQQQYDGSVAAAESLRSAEQAAQAGVTVAEAGTETAASHIAREQAHVAQAQAGVEAAKTAPQQVASMQGRADSARGRYERAKAAVDQAQLDLEYTTIKAPISGIVSKKNVEVGQTVQAGQPLLAIVSLDDVWVTANFKETQLRDMRPGQKVTVRVDTFGGKKFEGHVKSIAAATGSKFSLLPPENATGNYVKVVQRIPVKITIDPGQDPDHLLRPGMSATPTVLTN